MHRDQARRWGLGLVLTTGCAGRGFVAEDEAADDDDGSSTAAIGATGDPGGDGDVAESGIFTVTATAADDDDDDDDGDDGVDESTGDPIACAAPSADPIRTKVVIVDDTAPLPDGSVLRDFDCEIQTTSVEGPNVVIGMDCDVAPSGYSYATLIIELDAAGITVPADLVYPTQVRARVSTYSDSDTDQFPWRRADHVALYLDDVLVLGVAAGAWWPSTEDGDADPQFWSPLVLASLGTDCPAQELECHRLLQSALGVTLGDETAIGLAYSVVQIGGYDVHVGEMVGTDSPQCDEPGYGWLSFAIAPTP
jgi:hypothetical protein